MNKNRLIIFVKNEETGRVKTRLAKSVGNEKALQVYQKLLGHTYKITKDLAVETEVWYSRFIPKNDICSEGNFIKYVQSGSTLGQRMLGAFEQAFGRQSNKVIIIGSDCAELTTEIISVAFKSLDTSDFVIGPAQDGGYYLLGMRQFHPGIFKNIEWSTDSVYNQTIKKMEKSGGSIFRLKELNDVDTIEDWNQVESRFFDE